jgi:glyoxylase-like metal-dependent hydrolase (beta-lactamase superfamily II)
VNEAAANSGGWFALEELEPGTWLAGEPGHVNCFLAEGAERAVLVDTGLGLADIGSAVRELTDKPVLVVNTHSHSDHRGGNWRFAEVAAHPLAAKTLTEPVDREYLMGYLKVAREQLAAYQRAREADDRFFHLFTAATRPRPLPSDADGWTVPAGPAPRPLADGQRIDLGGRELTVLHSPGHSPDSLCLLDERAGLLFAGDTLITGDFWAHTPDTEIEVFAATLRKLAGELAGALTAIYPAHTLRYGVRPGFLRAAADAFEAIVDGSSTGMPGTDLLRRPASRHEFAEFTVLRPLELGMA